MVMLILVSAGCSSAQDVAATQLGLDPSSEQPLADFFGVDINDAEALRMSQVELERQAGTIAQECMLGKGFEFTPPRATGQSSGGATGTDVPAGSDAWVLKYGFGISTLRLVIEELNRDYLQTLTESERAAYEVAYRGAQEQGGGCLAEAGQYMQAHVGNRARVIDEFGDQLANMYVRAEADPRVVAFYDTIGECVAGTGRIFEGFGEATEALAGPLQGLILDEAGLAKLAELQAQELGLARAVLECGGGPDDVDREIGPVTGRD